MIFVFLQV